MTNEPVLLLELLSQAESCDFAVDVHHQNSWCAWGVWGEL